MVVSLLFSQLALATYVCPQQTNAAAMAAMMASGMPCNGMDMEQPALCAEHSAAAPQSFEVVKLPTPSVPAIIQVLEFPFVLNALEAGVLPRAAVAEADPPPEPVFLLTLRLRV